MGARSGSGGGTRTAPCTWGLLHFGDGVPDPELQGLPSPAARGHEEPGRALPRGSKRLLRDDDPEALLMGCVILIPIIGGL